MITSRVRGFLPILADAADSFIRALPQRSASKETVLIS